MHFFFGKKRIPIYGFRVEIIEEIIIYSAFHVITTGMAGSWKFSSQNKSENSPLNDII